MENARLECVRRALCRGAVEDAAARPRSLNKDAPRDRHHRVLHLAVPFHQQRAEAEAVDAWVRFEAPDLLSGRELVSVVAILGALGGTDVNK